MGTFDKYRFCFLTAEDMLRGSRFSVCLHRLLAHGEVEVSTRRRGNNSDQHAHIASAAFSHDFRVQRHLGALQILVALQNSDDVIASHPSRLIGMSDVFELLRRVLAGGLKDNFGASRVFIEKFGDVNYAVVDDQPTFRLLVLALDIPEGVNLFTDRHCR